MSTDKAQSSTIRLFLPFVVPLVLGFLGTGLIAIKASQAYGAQQCGLGLPWDISTSYEILQKYYGAAWKEVETLRRISSRCIAELHAETVAAYVCTFGAALLCGLIVFVCFGFFRRHNPQLSRKRRLVLALLIIIGSLLMLAMILFINHYYSIIDFEGNRRRFKVNIEKNYIDISSYWWLTQKIFFPICLMIWFFFTGISSAVQLIEKR